MNLAQHEQNQLIAAQTLQDFYERVEESGLAKNMNFTQMKPIISGEISLLTVVSYIF